MKFDDVVDNIGSVPDLKRIASAHVVDYRNLKEKELRDALKKVKPQYLHPETVYTNLEEALCEEKDINKRVLSMIILSDILLEEYDYTLPNDSLEEQVIAFEQKVINQSNEIDILKLSSGKKDSQRFKNLQLYSFVLQVAWEHRNTKTPDEANLLRKLRRKLKINEYSHIMLEAKLGKFPKPNNELHTRGEISSSRRFLQGLGLLFSIKDKNGDRYDIIPEELVKIMREYFRKEIRTEGYMVMLQHKWLRKKSYLQSILKKAKMEFSTYETISELQEKIIRNVFPSTLLATFSSEKLYQWCSELKMPVSGSKKARIRRIIDHYDQLNLKVSEEEDERELWYKYYEEFASRNHELLRSQELIEKDLEIEHKFEEATSYLFEKKLNHTPLKQPGSNRPDGLLSFKDMYVMWDNKSKEAPGLVNLKEHIKQFNGYIEHSDKPVPIFLVIAPGFTEESEMLAIQYAAEHIGRNIVLMTAKELKELSEEWASDKNKKREEPFPLGFLAKPGRFNRQVLGKLI